MTALYDYIKLDDVTDILLPDGWHQIENLRFAEADYDGDPPAFICHELIDDGAITAVLAGPVGSILAYRS